MKALFLILAITLFASCKKHVSTQLFVISTNIETLSFESENTNFSINATQDTTFYCLSETNQKVKFNVTALDNSKPFVFDVYQTVQGVDMRIAHIYSKNTGEFKTEK